MMIADPVRNRWTKKYAHSGGNVRLTRILITLGAAVISTLAVTSVSDADEIGGSSDSAEVIRTITDATTGQKLVVTNEGDCSRVAVQQAGPKRSDMDVTYSLRYSVDQDCHIQIISSGAIRGGSGTPTSNELETAHAEGKSSAVSEQATPWDGAQARGCGAWGNVLHGSQTLQDIINIDIARYRYGHDRNWDTCADKTIMLSWWMMSNTSVPWNHPSGPPFMRFVGVGWQPQFTGGSGQGNFTATFSGATSSPARTLV